eukprot:c3025_g1_i2.p1 GENE.c3025_g1_i2~~c3025_g1_i2.p1  ORF type:complete len:170 (+),score=33.60 c3025_g1_i2:197-706(+)
MELNRDRKRTKQARQIEPKTIFAGFVVFLFAVVLIALYDPESLRKQAPNLPPRGYPEPKKTDLKIEVVHLPNDCPRKSKEGDELSMHYRGNLITGSQFDSSYDRGQPFVFTLGVGKVIQGWDIGLKDMCVGEKRKLTIPPHLAYGERGAGGLIPPHSTLLFDVELVHIK